MNRDAGLGQSVLVPSPPADPLTRAPEQTSIREKESHWWGTRCAWV